MSAKPNLIGILKAIEDLRQQVELIGTRREPIESMTVQEAIDRGIIQVSEPGAEGEIDQLEFDKLEAQKVEMLIAGGYKYPDVPNLSVKEMWALFGNS
jgi:hypothetical protein